MPINLDIRTGVQVAVFLMALLAIINVWRGLRSLRGASGIPFYRLRRDRIVHGWRLLFYAVILLGLSLLSNTYAEPIAYRYFPPSPTPTLSPTTTPVPSATVPPTITLTPTITHTPSETNTPTITPTPSVPLAIEAQFEGIVTPVPEAVFSPLVFTQGIDENYQPLSASETFTNPVGHLYAVFSYDGMLNGVQWTALWYREGELVHFETKPWDGGTGGLGYTDWDPPADQWLPGEYIVQIFVGLEVKVVGTFTVNGVPPTVEPSASPTQTPTPSPSPSPTPTIGPSPTPTSSPTPTDTLTPTITPTRPPTATPITPSPTLTRQPTATPITPTPTLTRQPTATES